MEFPQGPYLGCRVDGELELWLLSVVDGEPLHEEGGEPGPGAATKTVEDEEPLKTCAGLGLLPATESELNDVINIINNIIFTFIFEKLQK